jgi:hypothetical protein
LKATLLLADYAQVADGKLNVIGAGWNLAGPQAVAYALAVLLEVPWHQTNEKHRLHLALVDADGQPVPTPLVGGGMGPLTVDGEFEVGRPPGTKPGTALNFPLAVNLPAQPLAPDSTFEWRLEIDGETQADWRAVFSTRPA